MAETFEYKCPCCGGKIVFDSNIQKLKCPYCDTEFEAEALKEYDSDLQNDKNSSDDEAPKQSARQWENGEDEHIRVYVCSSCGGEVICDENTAATSCPYCGNTQIITGNLKGVLKPDLVIPFKTDKRAAMDGYLAHIKGKKLLPRVFKDKNHIDEIKGIYIPFWMFDAGTEGTIRYRATLVRHWSDSKYDYTETSHFSVLRGGEMAFKDVPADGSKNMPDDLTESLEPFNLSQAVDFQTAYLSGFFADKYDVGADESVIRANARMRNATDAAFRSTVVGYTTVSTEASSIRVINGDVKYALLPVWLLNTTFKDRRYTFAMNGQTGKFIGDLPLDKKAFCKWLFGLWGIIAAALYLIIYLIGIYSSQAAFPWMENLALSLLTGFIISIITVFVMKGKLKSVRADNYASSYIVKKDISLRRDTFLFRNVTRIKRPEPQSNSHGPGGFRGKF